MIEPDVSVPTISVRQRGGARGAGAGRGARRVLVGVDAVEHLAGEVREARRLAAEVVRVLGQAELAEDHDTALAQLLGHAGVDRREGVAQREVARRRVHALHVDQVLEQDRQAVRGTAELALLALLVQQRGVLDRLRVELRDGVEARAALVERRDAGDVRAGQLDRRELALFHQLDGGRAVQRLKIQIGGRCGRGGEAEDARDRKQPCRGSSEVHGREGGGLIGASHWTGCRIRTRPSGVEQSLGCE